MKRSLLLYFALASGSAAANPQVPDSTYCSTITVQVSNYFSQRNYEKALPLWREAMEKCPAFSKSIYENGSAFFEKLIAAEMNLERREDFTDSLLLIYDKQIKYFNDKGNLTGKKGFALYRFVPARKEEAIRYLGESLNESGEKTHPLILFHYFQGSAQLYNDRILTTEELASVFYKVSSVFDANRGLSEYDEFGSKVNALFGVLFSCEMIEDIYSHKSVAKKDTIQRTREFVQLSNKKKCTGSIKYEEAVTKLYRLSPDPLSAGSLAQLAASKGNPAKAAGYYNDAVEMESDANKKANLLMDAAEFQLRELKSFPQSRTMAMRAAILKPWWGKPWLFIGDLYFNSTDSCTGSLKGISPYWAAADKYLKAKSVDSSVTAIADKKLEQCNAFYPGIDELDILKMKEGDPYETGCWIGEKTTVKYRK